MIDPLVPPEVDLRDFDFMPLGVAQLRDSTFTATVKPEEFRAGVLLWCAAWHQVPAATLPDDDVQLAKLAGYGFAVKDWKRVKAGALYGWKRATDGRLHHATAAKKALEAWESRLKHQHMKECDRIRKENKKRLETKLPALPIPTFEQWKSAGKHTEFQQNGKHDPPESEHGSAGFPPENGLNGSEAKGREGIENRDVGVTPTIPGNPQADVTGHVAVGKAPKVNGAGQNWRSPAYVAATAQTLGIARRQGEGDDDFKDRVYTEVQHRTAGARA